MKKAFKEIKLINIICLTIAGIINSIGVTLFLAPLNLFDSGLSGTSYLLDRITPDYLTLSIFLIVLNFPFYIIANRKIGFTFLFYSLYAILIYSVSAALIQNVLPIDFSEGSPIVKDDKLLAAIFGGLISGLGSGLVIRFGGAIDGVEVMAVLFAKRLSLTVGTFIMIYNIILYIISAIIFNNWMIPLYSILAYYVGLKTIDAVVEGFDKGKAGFIITDNPNSISSAISETLKRTVTIIDGHGYYSNMPKKILYVVINRFELPRLKQIVRECDPQAFVSVHDVSETLGTAVKYRINYQSGKKNETNTY